MANNTHLEHVIPLPEAARRLGFPVEILKTLVERGKIRAVQFNGEVAVPESEIPAITREQFEHLRGRPITIAQAARPAPRFDESGEAVGGYGVPDPTIRDWVKRNYVHILENGYGKKLDEADIAYCAAIYHLQKKIGTRAPLFDEAGRPYQLKHPDLSEYRRRRKNGRHGRTPVRKK
jgi:hypothetical protein